MAYNSLRLSYLPPKVASNNRRGKNIYSKGRWTRISKAYREKHPECEINAAKDIVKPAQVVDHILPERFWPEHFTNELNFQAITYGLHARKSRMERGLKNKKDWLKRFNKGNHGLIKPGFDINKLLTEDERGGYL